MSHVCKQELRIAKLEADMTGQNKDILNLIRRLDNLTRGLWALVLTMIPTFLTMLGFLVWEVMHK